MMMPGRGGQGVQHLQVVQLPTRLNSNHVECTDNSGLPLADFVVPDLKFYGLMLGTFNGIY